MSLAVEKHADCLEEVDVLETMDVLCSLAPNTQRPELLRQVVLCSHRLLSASASVPAARVPASFVKLASLLEKWVGV